MGSSIKQFYDRVTNDDIYQVTHERAVRDNNGTTV